MRVPLQKVKSCKEIQSEEQTARFISFIAILRAIELFSRTHVTDKAGDFFASKIWQNNLQALILFRSALKSRPQVLFDVNQKEHGYRGT